MNTIETSTFSEEAYIAPAVELIEMSIEGVLCESNEELGEVEGEW